MPVLFGLFFSSSWPSNYGFYWLFFVCHLCVCVWASCYAITRKTSKTETRIVEKILHACVRMYSFTFSSMAIFCLKSKHSAFVCLRVSLQRNWLFSFSSPPFIRLFLFSLLVSLFFLPLFFPHFLTPELPTSVSWVHFLDVAAISCWLDIKGAQCST